MKKQSIVPVNSPATPNIVNNEPSFSFQELLAKLAQNHLIKQTTYDEKILDKSDRQK